MTTSALLVYLSAAVAFVALVFFLFGFSRKARLSWRREGSNDVAEQTRLRALQRTDYKCSAGLLVTALLALGAGTFGSGPWFNEPSGNTPGAVLLITIVVAVMVVIALLGRHMCLSRALQRLERPTKPPGEDAREGRPTSILRRLQ
jgi:CBS domain containing-hemolysin-like protein